MRTRILTGAAAVATGLVALTLMTGCAGNGGSEAAAPAAAAAPATPAAAPAAAAPASAEDVFVLATAAHLCAVQSTVYDDPAAMAAAYEATPEYPGLTPAQVKDLQQRMANDTALIGRVSDNLQQTCKPES
jgi:hypothetical protein